MRLALAAAAVLALTAAAPAPPRGSHHAPARPHAAGPLAPVRAVIVSGNPQAVRAYAAYDSRAYLADFATLVMRVDGPPIPPAAVRRIRFHCVRCTLAPTDQPADSTVTRKDESTFSVAQDKGRVVLKAVISSAHPHGDYTIVATPDVRPGERPVAARFALSAN